MISDKWNRGDTIEWVLTVEADGELRDLTTASAIELEVKAALGGADPALIALAIGSGITLRAQSGATLGQADVLITSAQVDALEPGVYWVDVVGVWPGSPDVRKHLVDPYQVLVGAVVNRP